MDATPTVSLSASPHTVLEGSSVTVTATLSRALASAVTIPLTITDDTAEPADHGTLASIEISAGMTTGMGTITTNQDSPDMDDETFTVELGTLPASVTAGSPRSVRITITDDDTTLDFNVVATPACGIRVSDTSVAPETTLTLTPQQTSVTAAQYRLLTDMEAGGWRDIKDFEADGRSIVVSYSRFHVFHSEREGFTGFEFRLKDNIGVTAQCTWQFDLEAEAALDLALEGLASTLLSSATGVISDRIAASDGSAARMPGLSEVDAWMSAFGLQLSPVGSSDAKAVKTNALDPHAHDSGRETAGASWNRPFALSLDTPADGKVQAGNSQWTLWGAGDLQKFRREQASDSARGSWRTAYLGLERRFEEHSLGGLALSVGRGKAEYGFGTSGRGRLETRLKALYPYFKTVTANGVEVWAMAGAGQGRTTNNISQREETDSGRLRMRMAAAGLRLTMADWPSMRLSALADAGVATLSISGERSLAELKSSVRRIRAGLELSGTAGAWLPYVQLNVRREGGDRSATGLDAEAGARYAQGRLGVELRGRLMRLAGDTKYRESGAGVTLRYSPGADGAGLSLTLSPSWGRPDGTDLVWRASPLPSQSPAGGASALWLTSEIGYGIQSWRLPGLVTPTLGYGRGAQGDERMRIGITYTAGSNARTHALNVGFGLERRKTSSGNDWNSALNAKMRW